MPRGTVNVSLRPCPRKPLNRCPTGTANAAWWERSYRCGSARIGAAAAGAVFRARGRVGIGVPNGSVRGPVLWLRWRHHTTLGVAAAASAVAAVVAVVTARIARRYRGRISVAVQGCPLSPAAAGPAPRVSIHDCGFRCSARRWAAAAPASPRSSRGLGICCHKPRQNVEQGGHLHRAESVPLHRVLADADGGEWCVCGAGSGDGLDAAAGKAAVEVVWPAGVGEARRQYVSINGSSRC